jgi:peroxiredoxin
MRKVIHLVISLALAVSPLVATAPVPRKSPEFSMVEPSGKRTQLSSFKGKVVLIEFLLTNCPHCMRVASTITKLHRELGALGFQPIGIAFDEGISGKRVSDFVEQFGVSFPIGYSASGAVDSYLGRALSERFQVPQIVVIDRKGIVRAQSRPVREVNLEDENYLRTLIGSLLKEAAPAAAAK